MIHEAAARGFSKGAPAYASGRPDYPSEIVGWLTEFLGLGPSTRTVDLGAGTGKFTASLVKTGTRVLAVEPVAEMRRELENHLPDVDALAGTATAIPAADESVDAVTCAQAFHWFATPEALKEIRRVLRPGGHLGLIWNVRDQSVDWVQRLSEIMAPYEGQTPRFHEGQWRRVFPADGFAPYEETIFSHIHVGPPQRVIMDRIMSVSFMAALDPEQDRAARAAIQAAIDAAPELAGRNEVGFPYQTVAARVRKLG